MEYLISTGSMWLLLALFFIILEAVTYQLVSVWFVAGAAAAWAASLLKADLTVQTAVFVVVSGILLFATYPAVKKIRSKRKSWENTDRYINKTGIVTKDITPEAPGKIIVNSTEWTAEAKDITEPIKAGSRVRTVGIEGVTIIVEQTGPEP